MFRPSAMTTYAAARTMSLSTSALGPTASGASAASAISATGPSRRRERRSTSGAARRAMRVRRARHRAPARMAAGMRVAQAAGPLGRSEGIDPPGQEPRADAIERRAVLRVEGVDLLAQDREASGGDLARLRPPGPGERHVHGAPVGGPAATRHVPVGFELVHEPDHPRMAQPEVPAGPANRAPGAKPGKAGG